MERDYDEVKNCELCGKGFGITRTRHKCKRCKLIICADCGKTKSIIIGHSDKPHEPHRICNPCSIDVTYQKEFRSKYQSKWNTNSGLGEEWFYICVNEGYDNLDYARYISEAEENPDLQTTVKSLQADLYAGRADREHFNYSMVEYLHYSQEGIDKEEVRRNVENVVKAFYGKYKMVHCNILTQVVVFLLTITDESRAYTILSYLYERIIPREFWNRASEPLSFVGFLREKHLLRRLWEEKFSFANDEAKNNFRKNFIKTIEYLLGGLAVNTVNFSVLSYTWQELFKSRNFTTFEHIAWKIISMEKAFFEMNPGITMKNFQLFSCRNLYHTTFADFKGEIEYLDKERILEEFDSVELENLIKRRKKYLNTTHVLKEMSINQLQTLYMEVAKLIGEVRVRLKEKNPRESIEITRHTFVSLLKGTLKNLEDEHYETIFDALDLYEQGTVHSAFVISLMLVLLTPGDLEPKLAEIYKLKEPEGKNNIDKGSATSIMEWVGEILTFLNELEPTLLFRMEVFELKERLRKKLKAVKNIGPRDLYVVIGGSNLCELLVDRGRRKTLTDYNPILSASFMEKIDYEERVEEQVISEEQAQLVEEEARLIEEAERQKQLRLEEEAAKEIIENEIQQEINDEVESRGSEENVLIVPDGGNENNNPSDVVYVQNSDENINNEITSEVINQLEFEQEVEKRSAPPSQENVVVTETVVVEKGRFIEEIAVTETSRSNGETTVSETVITENVGNGQITTQMNPKKRNVEDNRPDPQASPSCKVCNIF